MKWEDVASVKDIQNRAGDRVISVRETQKVSSDELIDIGINAREEVTGKLNTELTPRDVKGTCVSVSRCIVDELKSKYNFNENSVETLTCDFLGQVGHTFVSIHSRNITDISSEGTVYVDASVDQFCEENNQKGQYASVGSFKEIPDVDVMEPNCERKSRYSERDRTLN